MPAQRVAASRCLNCGYELDAVSHVENETARPKPGDATVCLCGHLMVFDDDMRLRAPTDAEIKDLAGDPEYLLTQKFTAFWRDKYPR